MLISLHLPKTAGTSFSTSLEEYFGDKLVKDYNDKPINTHAVQRVLTATTSLVFNFKRDFKATECIHGHFLPFKYLLSSYSHDIQFITWMRNPADRLVSHYNYWYETYDPNVSATLHKRVVEESWSLEKFCFSKELRNLYSQFLFAFPIEKFSFIGITENYDADFKFFARKYLSEDIEAHRVNESSKKNNEQLIDEGFVKEVERYHAADVALYRRAIEMSHSRAKS